MTGDENDIRSRLRMTLPSRWFGDTAPVLTGLLSGFATVWVGLHQLLQFVIQQSRLRTATSEFLDMAAQDFLSDALPRRSSESDDAYRSRLLIAMRRLRATRPAIISAANDAGYLVDIFEPAQPASTGAYNVPTGLAWGQVGAWGSMQMPLESLLVAHPGNDAFESELHRNLAGACPAGGALWVRIASAA